MFVAPYLLWARAEAGEFNRWPFGALKVVRLATYIKTYILYLWTRES
jgi:hypothetical protein